VGPLRSREILAVNELVPELADVTVDCDPPQAGDPRNAARLAPRLMALAACLDARAADVSRALADRLAHDAVAIAVRHAIELLP
jgi:hypothetical protein